MTQRRRLSNLPPSLLLLVAAMGCHVDQAKEISTYRKVLDGPVEPGSAADGTEAAIDVRQALRLTNRNNERLNIEGENYLQALIDRRRATANFLPIVTLEPSWNLRENSWSTGSGSSQTNLSEIDTPAVARVNLFNGFRDVARLKSAAATIDQRRALLLDLQEQLLLDTARVFFQVLRAERSVAVLENSLAVQDERMRDIRGRRNAGLARPLDVAQIEAQASATRVSLISARNSVATGRTLLAFLTGAPVRNASLIDSTVTPDAVPEMQALLDVADQSRSDVAAGRYAVTAARENVDVAFGQYYPSVTLDLTGYLTRESSPTDRQWESLLQANLPIFSAGLIEADVRQAWSLFRQAVLYDQLLHRQVLQEVQTSRDNIESSTQRLAELDTQLQAARQQFDQAEQSYRVGLATNLERVAAQDQLLTSELQRASEDYDRKLLYLDLLRATGRLREELADGATTRSVVNWKIEPLTTAPSSRPTTMP